MALNAEFFVKMPIAQKILILAALIVLMILGYYFLWDADLTKDYEAKQSILSEKRAELAKLETVEKEKEKLDRELKEMERSLEKAKEKLPTETEMERLFLTISDLGKKNGVQFKVFQPKPEVNRNNLYTEVPIELQFTGNYVYTMNFFYKVTHLPRIVNFTGVGITQGKGTEINVNCTAMTYKFLGR